MRTINPTCTNKDSFKYSILISLHYYELNNHPERINQLKKNYINKHNFISSTYIDFENNNPYISLTVYDEYGQLLHKSTNNLNNKATIIKLNNQRYNAIKPGKNKYLQLKELSKQFAHKELSEYIQSKIIY